MATQDVMHDRNYLLALMQRSPHDPLRNMAERQFEELDREDARNQQKQLIEEGRAQRQDQFNTTQQARTDRAGEVADFRKDVLAQREEAGKDRDLKAMVDTMQASTDPKVRQQIQNALLTRFGIDTTQMSTDEKGNAIKQFANKTGQAPAAETGNRISGYYDPRGGYPNKVLATPSQPDTGPSTPWDSGPSLSHNALATAPKTVNADGSVTTQLPSGGTATGATPAEKLSARAETAERMRLSDLVGGAGVGARATPTENLQAQVGEAPHAPPAVPGTERMVAALGHPANVPTNESAPPTPAPFNPAGLVSAPPALNVAATDKTTPSPAGAPTPSPGSEAQFTNLPIGQIVGQAGAPAAQPQPAPTPPASPKPVLSPEELARQEKKPKPPI